MVPDFPFRALLGPLLYAGIAVFGIAMLFVIGASEMGWASIFIFVPFIALAVHIITRPGSNGDAGAVARHLADFPWDSILRNRAGRVQKLSDRQRA